MAAEVPQFAGLSLSRIGDLGVQLLETGDGSHEAESCYAGDRHQCIPAWLSLDLCRNPLGTDHCVAGQDAVPDLLVVLPMVSYTVYAERRVSALIQDRIGPNRTGFPLRFLGFKKDFSPFLGGLGQPVADAVKFLLKEDFVPGTCEQALFLARPLPGDDSGDRYARRHSVRERVLWQKMVVADINVGLLFMFAISSVGVYGIVLAGWSSNSKYPFLGGIRAVLADDQLRAQHRAQRCAGPAHCRQHGTFRRLSITRWPTDGSSLPFTDGRISLRELLLWIPVVIAFITFTISMFAETNRLAV